MTIKVFIGSEPKTEIPRKVLEFSISEQTKHDVVFEPLSSSDDWRTKDETPNPVVGTGFSLLRWDIPRRCDYKGAAIYLDADIVCLDDIVKLWEADVTYPNDECSVWCTYQKSKFYNEPTPETSVMLIDCLKAKHNQPDYEASLEFSKAVASRRNYVKIMRAFKHKSPPQKIPDSFNRLNNYVEGKTKFLHYTKEPEQCWYWPQHPHTNIWEAWLAKAVDAGVVLKEEIAHQCKIFEPHTATKRGIGMHKYWMKYA